MENRKPVRATLIASVVLHGLYLLLSVGIMLLFQPASSSEVDATVASDRLIPALALAWSIVLFVSCGAFAVWICRNMAGVSSAVPGVLSCVWAALFPFLNTLCSMLNIGAVSTRGGANALNQLSELNGILGYVNPLRSSAMFLFLIGAALALYRNSGGLSRDNAKPIPLLFLLAAIAQCAHFIGRVLITMAQKPLRYLWTNDPDMIESPSYIPAINLAYTGFTVIVVILVLLWVFHAHRGGLTIKLPCVCILIYLGLQPALSMLPAKLQMFLLNTQPMTQIQIAVMGFLGNTFALLSPLAYEGDLLLAAAAALSLYRLSFREDRSPSANSN